MKIIVALRDVAFARKLENYSAWIVDATRDIAFERKLRSYFAWIVDALSDVAFEWKRYVERIIRPASYVSTDVAMVLCVDSRCPTRRGIRRQVAKVFCTDSRCPALHSVWTEALRG